MPDFPTYLRIRVEWISMCDVNWFSNLFFTSIYFKLFHFKNFQHLSIKSIEKSFIFTNSNSFHWNKTQNLSFHSMLMLQCVENIVLAAAFRFHIIVVVFQRCCRFCFFSAHSSSFDRCCYVVSVALLPLLPSLRFFALFDRSLASLVARLVVVFNTYTRIRSLLCVFAAVVVLLFGFLASPRFRLRSARYGLLYASHVCMGDVCMDDHRKCITLPRAGANSRMYAYLLISPFLSSIQCVHFVR